MSDKERKFHFPSVEAVEKVVPSAAGESRFLFPDLSIITAPYIDSTAITTNRDVIIGQDSEKNVPVRIGEREREGGFYVLGQPRMGKSNLLISMALQDIVNGRGLLFIDPHYDAINKLLARIPKARLDDVILLDPSDNTRSFGINLLHCPDPENEIELDKAAGRVRDIFTKLWADERGELGIWLNKIMTNAVHRFASSFDGGRSGPECPFKTGQKDDCTRLLGSLS